MTDEGEQPQWHSVLVHPERPHVREAALVLESVGIENRIHRIDGLWHLLVRPSRQIIAEKQISTYIDENSRPPPTPQPVETIDSGWPGVLAYLLVIWMLPMVELLFGDALRYRGIMWAGAVTDGEWWRTITALTLHNDFGHLFANTLFGTLFGFFVGRYLGSGIGWMVVMLAAAMANGLNAAIQPAEFRSLGASTAVFAALGLTATFVWRRGYMTRWGWRRSFAPVFAAIALVAYTGTGGENTDVAAHVFGFIFGALWGLWVARWNIRWLATTGQRGGALLALGLVGLAWALAFQ